MATERDIAGLLNEEIGPQDSDYVAWTTFAMKLVVSLFITQSVYIVTVNSG